MQSFKLAHICWSLQIWSGVSGREEHQGSVRCRRAQERRDASYLLTWSERTRCGWGQSPTPRVDLGSGSRRGGRAPGLHKCCHVGGTSAKVCNNWQRRLYLYVSKELSEEKVNIWVICRLFYFRFLKMFFIDWLVSPVRYLKMNNAILPPPGDRLQDWRKPRLPRI